MLIMNARLSPSCIMMKIPIIRSSGFVLTDWYHRDRICDNDGKRNSLYYREFTVTSIKVPLMLILNVCLYLPCIIDLIPRIRILPRIRINGFLKLKIYAWSSLSYIIPRIRSNGFIKYRMYNFIKLEQRLP